MTKPCSTCQEHVTAALTNKGEGKDGLAAGQGPAARLKNSACSEGYLFSSSCPYSSHDPVVSSRSCTPCQSSAGARP